MSRVINCDPGGEYLIPFAQKKVKGFHDEMLRTKVASLYRVIMVDDATRIHISVLAVGNGVFIDKIRITAGGTWHFYYVSGSAIYLGEIGKNIIRTGAGILVAARSLDKPFGMFTEGGQLKVINPARKVSRVRGGEFDANGVSEMSVNATTWGGVFPSGADGYLATEAQSLFVPGAISGTYAAAEMVATGDNFYFVGRITGFPADQTVTINMWDLNAGAKVVDAAVTGFFLSGTAFGSTYYDAFASVLIGDGGLASTVTFLCSTGGAFGAVALGSTPYFGPGGAPLVTTKTSAYQFVYIIDITTDFVVSVGCARCLGTVDPAGAVSYAVSYAQSAQVDGILDTYGFVPMRFVVATRAQAYVFAEIIPNAGPPGGLYLIDSAGATVLLGTYTIDQTTGAVPEAVVAATHDTPWLVAVMPTESAGPRRIRFFSPAGVGFSTDEIVRAKTGSIAVSLAGATKTTVYVQADGSGGETWLIGSDGTIVDITAALPTFTTGGGIGGFHTTLDTIYGLTGGTFDDPDDTPDAGVIHGVFHVTDKKGTPAAPVVKRYAASASSTAVLVPARSNILSMQEFEAWNV